MLFYEKRFVETNKVALIAWGSETSTHLKLLPSDQTQQAQLTHDKQESVHTHFYLDRSLSVQKEKEINFCALLRVWFPTLDLHSTLRWSRPSFLVKTKRTKRILVFKQHSKSRHVQGPTCQVQGPFKSFCKSNKGIQIIPPDAQSPNHYNSMRLNVLTVVRCLFFCKAM